LCKDSQATGLTMKIPQTQVISTEQAHLLLHRGERENWNIYYLPEKHQLVIESDKIWLCKLYLPWTFTWLATGRLEPAEDIHFCLTLIRAGQAVAGYFHQGKLLDHKVFRAYMVRQKQGKSQFKHLKTKGKSRAGSRIRLEETSHFFKEIHQRLQIYNSQYPLNFWGLGCSKTWWPLLFNNWETPILESKTMRLMELPYPFKKASFEELQILEYRLRQFHLLISPFGQELIPSLLDATPEDEEDFW
jgi:Bacteroidetes VLRF1 release factor